MWFVGEYEYIQTDDAIEKKILLRPNLYENVLVFSHESRCGYDELATIHSYDHRRRVGRLNTLWTQGHL